MKLSSHPSCHVNQPIHANSHPTPYTTPYHTTPHHTAHKRHRHLSVCLPVYPRHINQRIHKQSVITRMLDTRTYTHHMYHACRE
mmetsp:Transcript_20518/g.58615  ORF Transcript_20518/g.58615 Transcript_20518/m.58615 type:complete len:84 (-) Transcript_20518:635-886(-)